MTFINDLSASEVTRTFQGSSAELATHAAPHHPCVAVIDGQRLSRECLVQVLGASAKDKWDVQSFATIAEAIEANDDQPLVAMIYIHQDLDAEIAAALEAVSGHDVRLLVVTDQSKAKLSAVARQAIQSGVRGLLSTADSGFKILYSAIDFILNGGTFIPPELLLETHAVEKQKSGLDVLTERQAQVFAKLKEGKPNKIIAFELGMSESTTKVHVRNIMSKFGVTNRTQAAIVGSAWA